MTYQKQFIEFALQAGALRFGEFTLKSGRTSPYFFNSGLFNSGSALARLGHFYAEAIALSGVDFDMLFGPAYKGIPLVAATAIALAENHQRDVPYAFNRKETKDHGEGGDLVGAKLSGKVLIIDDVISAGTSIRESIATIKQEKAMPVAVMIALDRQELGTNTHLAMQEINAINDMTMLSIICLNDLLIYLKNHADLAKHVPAVKAYQRQYGIHNR